MKANRNWAQEVRLQAIETLAYWLGRVNTTHLIERFGISRLSAQGDISRYLQRVPGNLSYNRTERCYLPTSIFKLILTKGEISEYLYLEAQTMAGGAASFLQVQPPTFALDPTIIRPVLQSIHNEQAITIQYRSLAHPQGTERTLFPHTLVNTGFRWHLRAYCLLRKEFRDFNLARIASSKLEEPLRPTEYGPKRDGSWNRMITLQIIPNPDLSEEEQSLIRHEFGFSRGNILKVPSRACLAPYVLQAYQIEVPLPEKANPKRHRLLLLNYDEVKDFLWS